MVPRVKDGPAEDRRLKAFPRFSLQLVLVLALACQFGPWTLNPLLHGFSWLALLLLSAEGLGALLLLLARSSADIGLNVVVGLSAMVALAGPLVAWRHADSATCAALLGIGLIAQAVSVRVPRRARVFAEGTAARARDVAALLVLLFFVASALTQWRMHPYDDALAYTPLVKKLLSVGHLDEPFSLRRLSGLGAHSFLTALVHTRISLAYAFACDRGLCLVALALLLRWNAPSPRSGAYLVVLVSVCSVFGGSGFSFFSGILLLCGSWLLSERLAQRRSIAAAALEALPLAALCALRQFDMAFVGLWLALRLFFARREGPSERRYLLLVVLFTCMLVAPWCEACVHAAGTFLFPLLHGNATSRVMPFDGFPSLGRCFLNLVDVLVGTELLCLLPLAALLSLAAFAQRKLPPGARRVAVSSPFAVASVLISVLLFFSLQGGNMGDLGRYIFPFACAALVLGSLLGRQATEGSHRLSYAQEFGFLLSVGIALLLAPERLPGATARIVSALYMHRNSEGPLASEPLRLAQESIPQRAKILVMVDTPAAFDYTRNSIDHLDLPGYASPSPGMPWESNSVALGQYLQAQGYGYVIFQRPQYSGYLLRTASLDALASSPKKLWQDMAHRTLLANTRMGELAMQHDVLLETEGVVSLRLRRP